MSSPVLSPEDRLPHRRPALLVTEAVREEGDELWVRGEIPVSAPTSDGHDATALYGIELAAQASGMWRPRKGQPLAPKRGYLVTIRRSSFAARLPVATPLLVHLTRKGSAGNLNTYHCEVTTVEDPLTVLVEGEFSTFAEY